MATAREKLAFKRELRRNECLAAQDAAAARHRFQSAQRALAAHDRALKRSGRSRSPRPIIRVAAQAMRHPVRPPPFYSRAGVSYSRHLQTIDGIRATSFHCAVSQTSQGSKAVAHQIYVERESAVVASFGTLGETLEERKEVWAQLAARAPLKRGCITLPEGATPDLREALRPVLQRLADDGAIPRRPAAAWLRQPSRRLAIRGLDHDRYETLAHAIGDAYRDAIDRDWAAATRAGKPPTLPPKILGHPPRSPMLQRRIVLELPHEVTDHAREQILRDFCARTFGRRGIPFHAVIHAPAAGNDDRNFHAHIVSTHHRIRRDRSTGRWDFLASKEMPAVHEFGRQITSNACSPEGKALPAAERRAIQRNLFRELRQTFATAANDALRMEIVLKRYDPRSYHDRGLAITPGSHLGPAAAAAAKRGGTVGRSPHRAAWLNAAAALAEAAPDEDPEEIRRLVNTEMVAQSLPHDCLPPDCHSEIQADRRRLARLRAKVESSFFALAARAHLAQPNAPALPQHPAPPAAEFPRPAPVPSPQATPQRPPTASGANLAIHGILQSPALRTARPQAISRPHRADLLAPALPQRPAPPATEFPRSAPVPGPQAMPQRPPTASGANLAIHGILQSPALRTARPQAISRPHRADLLAPALPQRPASPSTESPRPLPVPDPQATPQRPPTASSANLAIHGILPSPALRTARPQAISRPHRADLLAPALPQRPAPPATESPRPLPVPDPQATPQRPPTASGANLAIHGILPSPALRTARPQAISRPHRADLLAPALPQRPAPPATESPRPLPVPDPQATPQRPPTASGANLAIHGILPSPALRTARPQAISRPHRASLLAPAIPRTPDALHTVLHAHLPTMGAEYLTAPPMGDYFRTPIPGLPRKDGNRRLRAIECAEYTLRDVLGRRQLLFPPPTMHPSAAREFSVKRWLAWLAEHPERRTHLADEILASVWPDYTRDHDLEPAPIPPTPAALHRVLNGHLRQLGDEIVRAPAKDDGFNTSIPGLGPKALLCVFQTLHDQMPELTTFAPPSHIRHTGARLKYRCLRWSAWLDSPPDRRGYLAALLLKAVWPVHQKERRLHPALRAPEPPPAPSRPARPPQQPGRSH